MLFNSAIFLFAFLPFTLIGYYVLGKRAARQAIAWLAFMSLVFYAWWDWRNVPIFLISVGINFCLARVIASGRHRRWVLVFALAANLSALAYFKYAYFLLASFGANFGIEAVPMS